jgi:hypothetical protein
VFTKPGEHDPVGAVDDRRGGGELPSDPCDAPVLDQDVTAVDVADGGVHRQHEPVTEQEPTRRHARD